MNPVIIKGAKVASIAKNKAPLIKKYGGTAISLLLSTESTMLFLNNIIDSRDRKRFVNDFNKKYEKATSNEERKMLMEYYKAEHYFRNTGAVSVRNQFEQELC